MVTKMMFFSFRANYFQKMLRNSKNINCYSFVHHYYKPKKLCEKKLSQMHWC